MCTDRCEEETQSSACSAVQVQLPHCTDLSTKAQLQQGLMTVGDDIHCVKSVGQMLEEPRETKNWLLGSVDNWEPL